MSALRSRGSPDQPPPVPEATPLIVPVADSLSSDAAAPQTAAAPPPAPKATKPRPKIRSRKAVLTMVRYGRSNCARALMRH